VNGRKPPRKDKRGVDLISDALPFGRLWYGEPDAVSNAIGYAKFYSPSHDAVIRVYDEAGNVIEMHGRVQRAVSFYSLHVAVPAKRNFPLHWQDLLIHASLCLRRQPKGRR